MKALKEFQYTHDGFTLKTLVPGDDASDVPADAVPGLVAEGYIGDDDTVIETKVDEDPVETGEPVLTDEEVHADLEAMGVEFDPRDDLATKTALRDEARAARAEAEAPAADEPEAEAEAADPAAETDAYPGLSDAQEKALDLDGDGKPGGKKKA